jgi:hypothetical protein
MAISFDSLGDPSKSTAGYTIPMTVSVVVANGGRPTGVADSQGSVWRLVDGPSLVRLAAKILRRHVTYTYETEISTATNADGTEYFWAQATPPLKSKAETQHEPK